MDETKDKLLKIRKKILNNKALDLHLGKSVEHYYWDQVTVKAIVYDSRHVTLLNHSVTTHVLFGNIYICYISPLIKSGFPLDL